MNQSHTIKTLSPRVAQKRTQQLFSTFGYLARLDQSSEDLNPDPCDLKVVQNHFDEKGQVESSALLARIEGTSRQGALYVTRQDASPNLQHWSISYRPEAIICTHYSGDMCTDYRQKNEVLSLNSDIPSFVEEWRFSSRALAGVSE